MSILKDLYKLESAEDFFNYFDIPFDETVLKPYRLHILKKFSMYMEEVLSDPDCKNNEEKLYKSLKDYLRLSYYQIAENTPYKERLFKVHQDAGKRYFIEIEIPKNYHE